MAADLFVLFIAVIALFLALDNQRRIRRIERLILKREIRLEKTDERRA